MKLVTYGPPRAELPGVLIGGDFVLPLAPVLSDLGLAAGSMNTVVGLFDELRPLIEERAQGRAGLISLDGIRLGPPVPSPEKVIVVGGNYQSHVEEAAHITKGVAPSIPILVLKPPRSVVGPADALVRPRETRQLDYETELAVIIGRAGHRISEDQAMDHIAGYTIANDVTARDVLLGEVAEVPLYMQLTRGKGFPTFCPSGPWLVTKDEIDDPHKLGIRCWVNGELRQDDSTADMLVDVPGIVETCSDAMELAPGDIILTGTPAGCGGLMNPPQWLEPGDMVRMEIDGLGVMATPIEDE
jgi:2-keto-4-pentenoate hydratase/2-oxohepta-3-ene-1,7-dioic acid hydratase in catechol pathway